MLLADHVVPDYNMYVDGLCSTETTTAISDDMPGTQEALSPQVCYYLSVIVYKSALCFVFNQIYR